MPATLNGPVPKLLGGGVEPRHSPGWDTEVIILRGHDRAYLADRARQLAAFLETDVPLTDLAATLAVEPATGGPVLGVVSGSTTDLKAKLLRAADRIADPSCKHIRDSAGVYFFDQPLYPAGKVAFLFPGEGAQYAGMLADLCEPFPEVEETFAWCDQLAVEAGRPEESLRHILHPSATTPEEKAAAEARLRRIGPSLFGVLVADLAVVKVLWNLEIPVAAVAGHSVGELGALLASGALQSEKELGPKLADIMAMMERQEDEVGGSETALLAVGAGRDAVAKAAATIADGSVVVAMDNCPHQCVAVGPAQSIAAVEAALAEQGIVSERLPFRRPYRTPLFEPWMGPFREMFANSPFAVPHTPVYSGTTGELFPHDPEAIRKLAVDHWVSPVEFSRMVERMHADGVRLFVEAGPRGNLSAFVEDVLRGKPFAAVPANLPRRSGPTQINHLAAILTAHGVPLNLNHLFARRATSRVEWELPSAERGARSAESKSKNAMSSFEDSIRPTEDSVSVAVMDDYLAVMERFLDVQRDVMTAFLNGESVPSFDLPAPDIAPPPFPLLGDIIHHIPGQELTARRLLDEREDLYADHHTLGGRGVSRVDPGQNGLPVLPMTFSLETMAEAAAMLVPGKVVTAVRGVRLYRWLPFDAKPTTLEVRATVANVDDATGTVEVQANVRDLGNSFLPDAANKMACEAVVVLADHYPEPPAAAPFTLTNEVPCRASVEELRRNMFHGPLFQMIRSLIRFGNEGIEGTLEVQPRNGWFRSNPDPVTLLDPILTDAAMHLIGGWHLEQPDWSGRILLPIGFERLEYFGPPPEPGTPMLVRGHNEQETARQARHGLEVFGPNGRIWLKLTGGAYWRFYLPFGHVNFFGPKDEYFLSRAWPEAVKAGVTGRCHSLVPPADLTTQPVIRAAGVRVTMTPREQAAYLTVPEPQQADWFFARLLAKDAVRATWTAKHGEALFPADLETDEVNGRLAVRFRDRGEALPAVAVTSVKGAVAAFAAFTDRVGIGLVAVPKGKTTTPELHAQAARLAAANATGCDPEAVTAVPADGGSFTVTPPAAYTKPFRVQTAFRDGLIVATTVCEPA